MAMRGYNPKSEELVTLSREHDPMNTGHLGYAAEVNLDVGVLGRPLVRWRDHVLEVDVRAADVVGKGGQPGLEILLWCPRCSVPKMPHQLRITSDRKFIEYIPEIERELDKASGKVVEVVRGRLSVEAFECTWELQDAVRSKHGMNLCKWRVAIDHNVAKEA